MPSWKRGSPPSPRDNRAMDIFGIANLGRFRHIVAVLFKYGFDDIAERLNIPGKVLIGKVQKVAKDLSTWQRLRLGLEEMGPSFVKLGQILSQRPDLLPLDLIEELEKLRLENKTLRQRLSRFLLDD